MNRSTFVGLLAARFGQLTHRDAEFAVTTILEAMNNAMVRGHRIEVRGFGSFSVMLRAPRAGRNPRSGEPVQIPVRRVPHFKPGKALRAAVDRRTEEMALLKYCQQRDCEEVDWFSPTSAPESILRPRQHLRL